MEEQKLPLLLLCLLWHSNKGQIPSKPFRLIHESWLFCSILHNFQKYANRKIRSKDQEDYVSHFLLQLTLKHNATLLPCTVAFSFSLNLFGYSSLWPSTSMKTLYYKLHGCILTFCKHHIYRTQENINFIAFWTSLTLLIIIFSKIVYAECLWLDAS